MNSSSAPVEILRVVPSCGCTRVGEYPQRIEPGQPGGFTFSLNTQQIKGPFDKLVTIYTNDPKNPKIELHLKGECRHYVDLTPSFVAFGKITDQQPTFRTVEVRNNSQGPLRLELGASESGPFRFELSEVKPGDLYELRVTAMPPFPQGLLRGSATLKTNADAQKTVTVYASATVPERLEVQPQSILLPTAHASTRHASWSWPPRASRQR